MENTDIAHIPDNSTPLLYVGLSGKSYNEFESFRDDLKSLIETHNIDDIIGINSKILSESIDNFIRIIFNSKKSTEKVGFKPIREL